MDLRELIRSRMGVDGLTVKDLAAGTGYSQAYIYDLMKSNRRLNEESEARICDFLGIKKVYVDKSA